MNSDSGAPRRKDKHQPGNGGQYTQKDTTMPESTLPHTRKEPPIDRLSLQASNYTAYHYLTHGDERDPFILDAPYQRASTWGTQRRVDLIRSLLMGLPIGSVVLNHRGYSSDKVYVVIDGKQRIETLRAFQNDEFAVPADWFEDDELGTVNPDGTVTHSGLSIIGQRRFQNVGVPTLTANVEGIEAEAEIFLLINTGGVPQDDADLDRARRMVRHA